MDVLFIIGNGFDLRLGLPISYSDFLTYYKEQEPKCNLNVKTSKDSFFALMQEKEKCRNLEWRDLEIDLGDFTSSFTDKVQFLFFYRDINQSLVDYLSYIEEKVTSTFTQSN